MTREEWKDLKPEEKQMKVAELCGWLHTDIKRGYTLSQFSERIPDYLNDLNAMHEAEKILTLDQETMYNEYLKTMGSSFIYPWKTTASQRAEAFMLTMTMEK